APICEHVFCNTCITEWLTSSQTCPIDRTNLTIDGLKPAPRILRNFLSRLTLSCSNQTHGCPASLTLERFAAHLLECNFNPKRPVTCQSGCGMTILFEEHGNHNCIQSLKIELAIVQKENKEKNEEQEEKMSRMQSELDLLKAEIDALKKVIKEKQPASSDLQLLPTVGQSQAVHQAKFDDFLHELDEFFSNPETAKPVGSVTVGQMYGAYVDEIWQRVLVEKADESGVLCSLVDVGDLEQMNLEDLYYLPKEYTELPFQ
ncbi:hypothetical protein QYM36_009273, partial [Artemia franciscana]